MGKTIRDIYLITKNKIPAVEIMEHEMFCLNRLLMSVESPDVFCISHEYVNRNYISQNKKQILKASCQPQLNAFCFLINKN